MRLSLDAHLVVWFRSKQPCNLDMPHGWCTNSLYNLQYIRSNIELHTLTNTHLYVCNYCQSQLKKSEGMLLPVAQSFILFFFLPLLLSFVCFLSIFLSSLCFLPDALVLQYINTSLISLFRSVSHCAPSLHPHITPPLCLHSPLHIWRAQGPRSVHARSTTSICVCVCVYSCVPRSIGWFKRNNASQARIFPYTHEGHLKGVTCVWRWRESARERETGRASSTVRGKGGGKTGGKGGKRLTEGKKK